MTRRAAAAALVACVGAAALAGCATSPPQPDPVQLQLADLGTRLTRVERVVDNRSLLDLSNQLDETRADQRTLHNEVDELRHRLDQDRKRELAQYADLDARLKKLEAEQAAVGGAGTGSAGAGADAGAGGAGSGDTGAVSGGGTDESGSQGASNGAPASGGASAPSDQSAGQPAASSAAPASSGAAAGGDQAAYQAAFDRLKSGDYAQAAAAFKRFLADHPNSDYAPNAQYWIGWTYYVNREFEPALHAFQAVIDDYSSSTKVPDAMLNVGYCEYELKHRTEAQRVLRAVIAKYPGTSAARLAAKRLAEIRAESR